MFMLHYTYNIQRWIRMKSLRKCIACGALRPREEMIKITKEHSTGNVVINPNSKTFGRSAYLCYNQDCIEQAFKKNKLNRILKTNQILEKAELTRLIQD